jgi:hypothetical protein
LFKYDLLPLYAAVWLMLRPIRAPLYNQICVFWVYIIQWGFRV